MTFAPFGIPYGIGQSAWGTAGVLDQLFRGQQPQLQPLAAPTMPKKNSLFGSKTSDVLGTIGDFALVATGRNPIHGPNKQAQQRQQAMAQAMSGFADDPMTAVRNLASIGATEEAAKLYDTIVDNQNQSRKTDLDSYDSEDKFLNYVGATMKAANPQTMPQIARVLNEMAKRRGFKLPMEIGETYDQAVSDYYTSGAYPVKDRMSDEALQSYRGSRLEQMDRGLDIQEENNEARNRNTAVGNQIRAAGVKVSAANAKTAEVKARQGGGRRSGNAPSLPNEGQIRKDPNSNKAAKFSNGRWIQGKISGNKFVPN
jgi:hypothetical protein